MRVPKSPSSVHRMHCKNPGKPEWHIVSSDGCCVKCVTDNLKNVAGAVNAGCAGHSYIASALHGDDAQKLLFTPVPASPLRRCVRSLFRYAKHARWCGSSGRRELAFRILTGCRMKLLRRCVHETFRASGLLSYRHLSCGIFQSSCKSESKKSQQIVYGFLIGFLVRDLPLWAS